MRGATVELVPAAIPVVRLVAITEEMLAAGPKEIPEVEPGAAMSLAVEKTPMATVSAIAEKRRKALTRTTLRPVAVTRPTVRVMARATRLLMDRRRRTPMAMA